MILSYTDDDDDEVIYEDGAPSMTALPSADDQHFQAAFEVKYIHNMYRCKFIDFHHLINHCDSFCAFSFLAH